MNYQSKLQNMINLENQINKDIDQIFIPALAENMRVFQHIGPPTNST